MGKHPCLRCKNFIEEFDLQSGEFGKCKAFPKSIPYDTFAYMELWDKPKNCNNGIGFEPIEQIDDETA